MFGIGSSEFLLILLVALIVLGPKSLPDIAKTLGKAMGEFRRVSTEFQRTLNTEIELDEHEKRKKEAEKELFGADSGKSVQESARPAPKEAAPVVNNYADDINPDSPVARAVAKARAEADLAAAASKTVEAAPTVTAQVPSDAADRGAPQTAAPTASATPPASADKVKAEQA